MEDPDGQESAWADLLNGGMFTLLGGALPAIFVWQVFAHWGHWTLPEMTAKALVPAVQLLVLALISVRVLWFGLRMTARSLSWIVKDRQTASS